VIKKNKKARIKRYESIKTYRSNHKLLVEKKESLIFKRDNLKKEISQLNEKIIKYKSCIRSSPQYYHLADYTTTMYTPHTLIKYTSFIYRSKVNELIYKINSEIKELRVDRNEKLKLIKKLEECPEVQVLLREEKIDQLLN
jgi:hypothetical protein